jgi:proteic killer suppression protein
VEISFKNNKLEKSFTDDRVLAKTYGTMAKKVKQRYEDLKSADNLFVISQYPAMRLHSYQGNSGIWSIDIFKNQRILFTINQNPIPTLEDGGVNLKAIEIIKIESVEDPH